MIGSAPPALSIAANVVARRGQISVSAFDLFGLVDTDGNPILQYTLFDPIGLGHWAINGGAQAANSAINITAAELSQTSYVFGSASETLYVRVNSGADWGAWQAFTASPYVNHAPVVTAQPIVAMFDTSLDVFHLFSAADTDGDTITKYQLWDSTPGSKSGHWIVNGIAQATDTAIDVTVDQLAHTSFHTAITGTELLWARAFDGVAWSGWKSFTVTVPADGDYPGPGPNHAPVVTASDTVVSHGQSVAASALFAAQDIDADLITWFEVWDSTDGASSGSWVLDGVRTQSNVAIEVSADQLAHLHFQSSSGDDQLWARAFDGREWSAWKEFHVTAPLNETPVVDASNATATRGQDAILATDLFTATDADGDSITRYAFWDTEGNGHWVLNGAVQATNAEINIAASQLSQMSYSFGSATDTLYVRAFDGTEWGTWQKFTAGPFVNQGPVVTTNNLVAPSDATLAASQFLLASDLDGDAITKYQLWDSTTTPGSGHWVVNGIAQATNTPIDVTADQLAQTSFHAGINISDQLWARAFDGAKWGAWQPFTVTVSQVSNWAGPEHAPVVSASDTIALHGESFAASSLFSVTDAEGDPVRRYELWDSTTDASSGHWMFSGVATQSDVAIEVTAAELANASFQSGSGSDQLWVRAFDGMMWSPWAEFHVTAPVNMAPIVEASDFSATHHQNIAASALFSVVDAENDAVTAYQFWDSTPDPASGHWSVNGVAQAANVAIDVTAAQLSHTTFQAGSGSDDLWVRVNDGMMWGAWKLFHATAPADTAPIAVASDFTASHNQNIAASALFSVIDAENDSIAAYQFWDSTADPASGHWSVNGIAQSTGVAIDVTAAQLSQTTFQSGSGSDDLWVRVNDGMKWSDWKLFHVNAPVNQGPVVTASNVVAAPYQDVATSSFFTATDPEGDAIVRYQLWDSSSDPASGHWTLNGIAQAANSAIDISAAQLADAAFHAETAPADLWARAFDGTTWGSWQEFHLLV